MKGSTIRAQLLLFNNKTEEEEEKDRENCGLLLKAGCGRRRSGVSQSWGTQSRLLSGRDEKTVSELGVYPGDGDRTVRYEHGDWPLSHACCVRALPSMFPLLTLFKAFLVKCVLNTVCRRYVFMAGCSCHLLFLFKIYL